MNKKSFSVETTYSGHAKMTYLTKAKNGKQALENLLINSSDFNNILSNSESNNMSIKIEHLKNKYTGVNEK